jgi:hypothetical protein
VRTTKKFFQLSRKQLLFTLYDKPKQRQLRTTFDISYQVEPRRRKRHQAADLTAVGVPVILAGSTSYITNKYMEKEEKAEIENIHQTVKMSNLQERDFINLVKSAFSKVDLEFDQVYKKFDEETTKQSQELGSLSDRIFF